MATDIHIQHKTQVHGTLPCGHQTIVADTSGHSCGNSNLREYQATNAQLIAVALDNDLPKQALALERERDEAAEKAYKSLAGYKFAMFGYWAGIWVHLNRLCPTRKPNPFRELVKVARRGGLDWDTDEADEAIQEEA
jgi:hypothetical protein